MIMKVDRSIKPTQIIQVLTLTIFLIFLSCENTAKNSNQSVDSNKEHENNLISKNNLTGRYILSTVNSNNQSKIEILFQENFMCYWIFNIDGSETKLPKSYIVLDNALYLTTNFNKLESITTNQQKLQSLTQQKLEETLTKFKKYDIIKRTEESIIVESDDIQFIFTKKQ